MDNEKLFLASNIKFLRSSKRKTQDDVAKLCRKKNTAVSNWEKGIREPDGVDLAILSNYFNISIDDLMLTDLRKSKDDINVDDNVNEKKTIFNKNGVEITIAHDGKLTDDMLIEINNRLLNEKVLEEKLTKNDVQNKKI